MPTSAARVRRPPTTQRTPPKRPPANPALFGPAAPRVKGGIDLVGDSYNADPDSDTYQPVPHPDPNPLDCPAATSGTVGHGSHVAGTAAGSGVLSTGATYTGPYNATTISGNSWTVGPGVAPKADLYAIRVFGCDGSTDVVVDAIEWAVDNDIDVINLSLGSPFGTKDSPDAVAATNAAKAGVVVVISAGNEGPNQYITRFTGQCRWRHHRGGQRPDRRPSPVRCSRWTPAALRFRFRTRTVPPAFGSSYSVVVLRNANGTGLAGMRSGRIHRRRVAGKLVVTQRGSCARVARAVFAQKAGAAAAAMIDTSTGYPPFEGPITSQPGHWRAVHGDHPVLRRARPRCDAHLGWRQAGRCGQR